MKTEKEIRDLRDEIWRDMRHEDSGRHKHILLKQMHMLDWVLEIPRV